MKKLAIASALLASLGMLNTAHAYQVEAGLSYSNLNPDHGDSVNGFGVDGTYYFKNVQPKSYPYNEAAFLDRASNVGAHYQRLTSSGNDANVYGGKLEYFVPSTDFYANGRINRLDGNGSDTTLYSAEVGFLPIPGLLVAGGVVGYDNDSDNNVDPSLRAKYVTQLYNYNVNLEAATSFGDTDSFKLGGDVYFDPSLSVGASVSKNDPIAQPLEAAASADNKLFSLRAKKYFTPQISVEGTAGFGSDANVFGIRGAYNF